MARTLPRPRTTRGRSLAASMVVTMLLPRPPLPSRSGRGSTPCTWLMPRGRTGPRAPLPAPLGPPWQHARLHQSREPRGPLPLRALAQDDGEVVLDLEALLAGAPSSGVLQEEEDDGGAQAPPEPWEAMVDRIRFDGGIPNSNDFRAPSELPSAYTAANGFHELDAAALRAMLEAGTGTGTPAVECWDVRGEAEFALGSISGARHVPFEALEGASRERLEAQAAALPSQPLPTVCLVCGTGKRSAQAQVRLTQVYGFTAVASLRGGLAAWEAAGGRLEAAVACQG